MGDREQSRHSRSNDSTADSESDRAQAADRRMARAMKMVESNPLQRQMYNQDPSGYLQSLGIASPTSDSSKLGLRTETLGVLGGESDLRLHITVTLSGPTMGGPSADPSQMTITATCGVTLSPSPSVTVTYTATASSP